MQQGEPGEPLLLPVVGWGKQKHAAPPNLQTPHLGDRLARELVERKGSRISIGPVEVQEENCRLA